MSAFVLRADISWPHAAVMDNTTFVYIYDVACRLDG
jgi:hypothetical protein